MPYEVIRRDNTYCVRKIGDTEIVACHEKPQDAYAQIAAIEASEQKAIDLTPTDAMAAEAQRGLDWRTEFNRGGTDVGIARARDIANKRNLSPDTVRRMVSFFARHEINKEAEGFKPGEEGYPSNGRIAWALWGGDPGQAWANRKQSQLESKAMEDKLGKVEAGYVPVSSAIGEGQACAACLFYRMGACLVVEGQIEPTGGCDYFTPQPAQDEMVVETRGLKRLVQKEQPLASFKAMGDYWVAVFSNNFKDLENEIITQGAWDRYIARLNLGLVEMPVLVDMHLYPDTTHGKALEVLRVGHMLVAIGEFTSDEQGQKAKDYYNKNKRRYTMSHGFLYPPYARRKLESGTVVYDDINTFEISVLPEGLSLPANPYTEFDYGDQTMLTEEQKAYIEQKYGKPMLEQLEQIKEAGETIKAAGVEYKDFTDATPEVPAEQPQEEDILPLLIEGQAEVLDTVKVMKAAVDAILAERKAMREEHESRVKTLTEQITLLQAQIEARPRRVDATETNVVHDEQAAKETEQRSENIEYDPVFFDMNVPINK